MAYLLVNWLFIKDVKTEKSALAGRVIFKKNDVTFLLCYKFYGYSPTDAQK